MSHYIVKRDAPANRKRYCDAGIEHHFPEAAVMIAFAMHLFAHGAREVELHPDGEHGKRFDLSRCLQILGFKHTFGQGKTSYGGTHKRGQQKLSITVKPGLGDVVAKMNGHWLVAECKGGVVNSQHAGQASRLRRGLCLTRPLDGERQVAVVPSTPLTRKVASRLSPRARTAGIEIALVDPMGNVAFLDKLN